MRFKRIGSLLLSIALLCTMFSISFVSAADGQNFYRAVAQIVQANWNDSFFSEARLNYEESTLTVDGEVIELDIGFSIQQKGLPQEVLTALDVQHAEQLEMTYAPSGEVIITNNYQTMRVLTQVKPGASLPRGVRPDGMIEGPNDLHILQFNSQEKAKAAVDLLEASSDVLYAEPDLVVSIASSWDIQSAAEFSAQEQTHLSWGVERIGADPFVTYLIDEGKQNAQVIVAVLDTGIYASHPWFASRLVLGFNAFNATNNPVDEHGHGTHVAGTVIDVARRMPNIKVMPVRVLDKEGEGTDLTIIAGIQWARENGANVLNMSLGGNASTALDNAVRTAINNNVTVVAAAGNENKNTENVSPARVSEAITVAAVNNRDNPAGFSNYGDAVDVAAPGVGIPSTWLGGGWYVADGTSMAAPHVAGAVALLLAENPGTKPDVIRENIRACVDPWTNSVNLRYGTGILNMLYITPGPIIGVRLIQRWAFIDRAVNTQFQLSARVFPLNAVNQTLTWSSSDESVATVDQNGLITGLIPGSSIITVTTQEGGFTDQITVDVVNVRATSVTLNISERKLFLGDSFQLVATVAPANADMQTIIWESSSPWNVSVDDNGFVTAVASGNTIATITARIYIGNGEYLSAKAEISTTFAPATGISLNVTEQTVPYGETYRLIASVLPSNAAQLFHWSSSDPNVATVSALGVITPKRSGTAIITVSTPSYLGDFSAQTVITVPYVPITGMTMNVEKYTLVLGVSTSLSMYVVIAPLNASDRIVEWTSSDPDVVLVNRSGDLSTGISGKSKGTAIITATSETGITASAVITVKGGSIRLIPDTDYVFPTFIEGEGVWPEAHTVKVLNDSDYMIGQITVTLSGDNANSFQLNNAAYGTDSITNFGILQPGSSFSFTVRPRSGLKGTHVATVTVSNAASGISEFFNISFTAIPLLSDAKHLKIAQINAVAGGLNSADYTAESWRALQTAISNAIAQVNAAATIEAVDLVAVPTTDELIRVYALTVNGGSGSGSYVAGAVIPITAGAAPRGKVFDKWTTNGGGSFADANSASTTFTMPAGTVTATAMYKDAPKGIFGTNPKWNGAWWHYILFFLGFGFAWMWF